MGVTVNTVGRICNFIHVFSFHITKCPEKTRTVTAFFKRSVLTLITFYSENTLIL